jgi:hypothetical protein
MAHADGGLLELYGAGLATGHTYAVSGGR